ncbi:GTPase [Methanobacterium sp. ACI-7]|uniref:GTPase n=1 Tax=unclassified Methanobacterium TaxID=2627676 RepID=UPI0039C1A14C
MNKKIIVLGNSGSWKTGILKHICSNIVQTTAMDYGNITLNGQKIHFFSPSGHQRFEFMQDILSKNIDGAIILINSITDITNSDMETINFIKTHGVPYILFANNQDLESKIEVYYESVYTLPISATDEQGIDKGINILLKLINRNELAENSQVACIL